MSGHWRFSSFLFLFVFILVGLAFGEDTAVNNSNNCEDCSSCAPEGCGAWFTGYCDSLWTVRADGLLLHRSKPGNTVLVVNNDDAPIFNANEFDLGISAGWDISIIRRCVLGTQWGIEGLYYSVDNWSASRGVERSADGAWVTFEGYYIGNDYPQDVWGDYRSGLHNIELNARRAIGCRGDFLIGFRYIDLRERMDIFMNTLYPDGSRNFGTYDIQASNELSGIQVGFDGHIFSRGRLTVDGLVKAGVFNDSAGNSAVLTQQHVIEPHYSAASANHTASLEEMAFTAVYELNSNWSFRAGYQLMWLQGVALASDQVAVSDIESHTATVDTDGSLFYHGAILGLECNF